MILVDSSVWIKFLKKKSPYFDFLLHLLEHREVVSLEIIFAELMQGAKNKRERDILQAYWENLPQLKQAGLYLEAGLRSGKERWPSQGVGLIDASLYLAAERNEVQLWTLDKKLQALLPKSLRFDPLLTP